MGVGHGNDLELTHELRFPHSLGLLYSAFTAFLGFEVNEGEYKVMGMAPYGVPRCVDKIWEIIDHSEDGAFELDLRYFSFHYSTKRAYSQKFVKLFGEPRDPNVPFFTKSSGYPSYYGDKPRNFDEIAQYNQRYADIAASIQLVTEELILTLARQLHKQTGLTRLCLAGGVALNSVANGRLLRETPFEELYIQPSAGDGGGAVGAAQVAWHCALGQQQRFVMEHAYWGQSYGMDDVRTVLNATGADCRFVEDDVKLVEATVDRLVGGKVVAWFQGRFEWGPRALGNRSILADPRKADMKDRVNSKIKFREPFRPFAPAVLEEESEQYFDLPEPERQMPARFMLLVVPVKNEKQELIPAVNHMGSARIQTVQRELNPLYYQLIQSFGQATGLSMLLNTSFNVRGEPIVNTPENALATFANSGIDTLVMGNYILDKS